MLKKILKTIGLAFIIFIVLFVSANFNFFWQNVSFYFHPHSKPLPPVTTTASSTPLGQPNMLTIPSLNITAPIIYATATSETIFQADLINGVVHYPHTANPGQSGNCYIFGHSSDYIWSKGHYKTVFATLPRIKIGDTIIVSNSAGQQFTYIVKQTLVVSPDQTQYLQQDLSTKMLTVQTSYPVGTALKRFLAIAELQ